MPKLVQQSRAPGASRPQARHEGTNMNTNIHSNLTINGVIGHQVELDGSDRLLVERELGDGDLLIHRLTGGEQKGGLFKVEREIDGSLALPDVAWFEEMLRQGRLRILRHDQLPDESPKDDLDHDEIKAKDPMAEARWKLVRALSERGILTNDPELSTYVTRIWHELELGSHGPKPTPATVRRWMRVDDPGLVTLRQMMSNSGRVPRAKRLDPEVIEILLNRVDWYFTARGHRVCDVRAEVNHDIKIRNEEREKLGLAPLGTPGKETVRRFVKMGLTSANYARKWGEQAAKARWGGTGQGLSTTRILQIALMDDTVFDTMTVFDADRQMVAGRPWLCVLLDVHSRCVLGWVISFTPPTVHTAAECLRRANRPKLASPERMARYPVLTKLSGKPGTILVDHGSNYASQSFRGILADLGIALQFAAVRMPTHKAMIERFFMTLKTWLADRLPGATLEPKLLREFNIDPEKEAVLTLSELELLIEEFLFVYHISIHSGINSQPLARWAASMVVHGRDVIADDSKLKILTGVTLRGRRLYKGAIRFLDLVFRDPVASSRLNEKLVAAEPHRSRNRTGVVATVDVKYDPADLSQILVRDHVSREWIALPCTDREYSTGLSLWQHNQVRSWAAKRNLAFNTEAERLEALRQLTALITELAPDMKARDRRAAARMLGKAPGATVPIELCEAEPRHDGLGPVIPQDTAENRKDEGRRVAPGKAAGRRKVAEEDRAVIEAELDELDSLDCDDTADNVSVLLEKELLEADDNDDERFEDLA